MPKSAQVSQLLFLIGLSGGSLLMWCDCPNIMVSPRSLRSSSGSWVINVPSTWMVIPESWKEKTTTTTWSMERKDANVAISPSRSFHSATASFALWKISFFPMHSFCFVVFWIIKKCVGGAEWKKWDWPCLAHQASCSAAPDFSLASHPWASAWY